jgi:biopolymer transport protein ExbB/TolQ
LTIRSILRDKDLFPGNGTLRALLSSSHNGQHARTRLNGTLSKASTMDASSLIQFGLALAAVAAALIGFNALVGKGPRGTVLIGAACLFTWAAMLPIAMSDPDELSLPPTIDLLVTVLRLAGLVGAVLGVVDVIVAGTSRRNHPFAAWALRQPMLWGIVACVNFFALLHQGIINSPLLARYCAGHPIEIIELTVFFVGLSALALRCVDVVGQFKSVRVPLLGEVPAGGERIEDCDRLLHRLDERAELRHTFVVRRLRAAIDFVRRKNSAEDLDQHLRHLEELEADQINAGYSMVRIIIWAIPILGLLGTVVGITIAVANLNPETLEESMSKVTHGLGVAFDHTATALSLTMLLMFIKSAVERVEDSLLARVDARVSEELVGRFQQSAVVEDTNVGTIRRMSEQVLEAVEALAARQAEVWKSSIVETHQQWADVSMAAGHIVRDSLSTAIRENLEQHARVLGQNALKHADRIQTSTDKQVELIDRGAQESVTRLRDGLEKLGELLVEALERHGEVLTKTEKELADENRQHLSEVEAALGNSMVIAAERQENLIRQSEHLLKEMQVALVEAAGATIRQQEQLVRQSDVLLKVVDSTGQITRLEESLAENLATVGKAHDFEEMALNLSAAIQLLSARLRHTTPGGRNRDNPGDEGASQAA